VGQITRAGGDFRRAAGEIPHLHMLKDPLLGAILLVFAYHPIKLMDSL